MKPEHNQIPGLLRLMMRTIVRRDRSADMIDDLEELYAVRKQHSGRLSATARVWIDALSICMRPAYWRRFSIHRSPSTNITIRLAMLRNNVLVALRGMRKKAGFTTLNALGLGVGLACVFFIGLYVRNELSYDRHHTNGDRIVRVVANYTQSGRHWAPIGPPIGPALAESYPAIEKVARFFPSESGVVVRRGDVQFRVDRSGFADSTYFDVFSFSFVDGDPTTALTRPGQVVISESLAKKVFGSSPVVGETLELVGQESLVVSGVFKDLPSTTHQPVDLLISMATFYSNAGDWLETATTWAGFHTYLLFHDDADIAAFKTRLPDFVDRMYAGRLGDTPHNVMHLELQPLYDIHLHSALEKEYVANGDIRYVYTFGFVALMVLLIAIVNFVNLSTARSTQRMREVGVRRSFGAARPALARQFLTESIVHALLSFIVGAVVVLLMFPTFRNLSGVDVGRGVLLDPIVSGSFLLIAICVGFVAGVYPAVVMSGFRPVDAFRAQASFAPGGHLRRTLVVSQFAVSIVLITVSIVVWAQLSFLRTTQLGFDKEHVLVVDMSSVTGQAMTDSPQTFKDALYEHSSIVSVSQASDIPGRRYSVEGMRIVGRGDSTTMMRVAWRSDYDYIDALGLELVEGRGFSEQAPTDTTAWILNEAAVATFGLKNPTQEMLDWDGYVGPIVGVIRNFNFASLHDAVEPLVIPLRPGFGNLLLVRYRGGEIASVIEHTRNVLNRLTPGELFQYGFLADAVDIQYRQEDKLRDVISWFSILGIAVACLGLFGLAAFTANRRTREIGIRKVLGASGRQIITLLTREFVVMMLAAIVVGIPVAYFIMHRWLSAFAFRIDLSPGYFLVAGAGAMLVALFTVGLQAARAASVDPVRSIRYE